MILRHHNEAESLFAVQKMDWRESAASSVPPSHGVDVGVGIVPMVHVSDDFGFDLDRG
jgi:hypothetical protein